MLHWLIRHAAISVPVRADCDAAGAALACADFGLGMETIVETENRLVCFEPVLHGALGHRPVEMTTESTAISDCDDGDDSLRAEIT